MDRFPLGDLLNVPGAARGDEAGLREIALRHRRRRARRARAAGVVVVVLAAIAGVGVTVLGDHAPRTPTAMSRPTTTTIVGVPDRLPPGLVWEVAPANTLGAPKAFGVALPGLVAGSVAFANSAAASNDTLSLARGLKPISVQTSSGVTVRTFLASYSGSPRLLERVERPGERPGDAASAAKDALYSCVPERAIVLEVSDRGFAGSFSVPLTRSTASQAVSLIAVWPAGIAERSPVEIVVVRTTARGARVAAFLPDGRQSSATAHGGIVVLAFGLTGDEAAHAGSVTVRLTGAGGRVTSQIAVPESGAFAEPLSGCVRVRRAGG